ncbi:hypothetical protein [Streptobacillus moniliformis]|uniref:hypothetical protein n=1 Tax=Streptobacillus moniliformis TaxID=34105 RepID=UPI0007E2E451|nr:hypothetical protein [Streptobacillus moniliformis]
MKKEKIENREVTCVTSYGTKENQIVVELIPTYQNYMNYRNFKDSFIRQSVINGNTCTDIIPMNLDFLETKEYKLLKSQILKIVVEGQADCEINDSNIQKVLTRNPLIFDEIMEHMRDKASDMGLIIPRF